MWRCFCFGGFIGWLLILSILFGIIGPFYGLRLSIFNLLRHTSQILGLTISATLPMYNSWQLPYIRDGRDFESGRQRFHRSPSFRKLQLYAMDPLSTDVVSENVIHQIMHLGDQVNVITYSRSTAPILNRILIYSWPTIADFAEMVMSLTSIRLAITLFSSVGMSTFVMGTTSSPLIRSISLC